MVKKKLYEVVCVSWTESEAGWGCRPDGCSLHLKESDRVTFYKEYLNNLPEEVPHEYSRMDGNPEIVYVSEDLFEKVNKSKNGIMLWESEYRKIQNNQPKPKKKTILEM